MSKKERLKRAGQALILTIIILIGVVIVNIDAVLAVTKQGQPDFGDGDNHSDGVVYTNEGGYKGEIFLQYNVKGATLTHMEHPWLLFASENKTLWCIEHKVDVDGFMSATEQMYWALEPEGYAVGQVKWDAEFKENVFTYYGWEDANGTSVDDGKFVGHGLVPDHYDEWKAWYDNNAESKSCAGYGYGSGTEKEARGDQAIIKFNDENMPGLNGKPRLKSIKYYKLRDLVSNDNQHALFVMTQKRIYENAEDVPDRDSIDSDSERKNGYFTVDEKQAAIWEIPDLRRGAGNDKQDRMLGTIALKWQAFYDKLHEGKGTGSGVTSANPNDPKDRNDNYADEVKAYKVETGEEDHIKFDPETGEESKEDIESVIVDNGEVKRPNGGDLEPVEIEGEKYTTFKYKDTQVEVDHEEQSVVLGPYCIDYTLDDDGTLGERNYGALDTYKVKKSRYNDNYGAEVDNGTDDGDDSEEPVEKDEWQEYQDKLWEEYQNSDKSQSAWEKYQEELWKLQEEAEQEGDEDSEDYDALIRFTAIEKIKVYNQNKEDIEKLGGKFKIVYKYDGPVEGDGEKDPHINERLVDGQKGYYYEFADGEEVPSFLSRKPFYIVVYKGTMESKDFVNFYAKIDFQYLESIQGELAEYEGEVWEYWYEKEIIKWCPNYAGQYSNRHHVETEEGDECHCELKDNNFSKELDTVLYKLRKQPTGENPQTHMSFKFVGSEGARAYKRYSIVLTSEWDWKEPVFELEKFCENEDKHGGHEGARLYGAEFTVMAEVMATKPDVHGNLLNAVAYFTGITNREGKIIISGSDFARKGISLKGFNGNIKLTFTETRAPADHKIINADNAILVTCENGEIKEISSPTANNVYKSETIENGATIQVFNAEDYPEKTPVIQLAKVDTNAGLVKEAYFNIHVAYTDKAIEKPDGSIEFGKVIDKKSNIIRGQTRGGLLNLTREDFLNMKYRI